MNKKIQVRRRSARAYHTTANIDEPVILRLANGATIIGQEVPGMDTAIAAAIPIGLAFDCYRPHLLEHLIFRHREDCNSGKPTDRRIEELGGFYTGYTSLERVVLKIRVLDINKQEALRLLCESLVDPDLSQRGLAREKRIVTGELQDRRSDPIYGLIVAAYKAVLEGHSLQDEEETIRGISQVKLKELVVIKRKYFGARNLHIGIAGPNITETLEQAAETVGQLPKKGKRIVRHRIPEGISHVRTYRKANFEDCVITIATTIPGYGHPDRYAIEIIANTLAGTVEEYGTSCRLWKRLRQNKGVVYQPESELDMHSGVGVLEITPIGILKRNLKTVREITLREIDRLRTYPISARELEAARSSLLINARRRYSDLGEVAESLAVETLCDDNPSHKSYEEGLRRVTPSDVRRVARTYLDENRLFIGTLKAV